MLLKLIMDGLFTVLHVFKEELCNCFVVSWKCLERMITNRRVALSSTSWTKNAFSHGKKQKLKNFWWLFLLKFCWSWFQSDQSFVFVLANFALQKENDLLTERNRWLFVLQFYLFLKLQCTWAWSPFKGS